MKYKNSYNEGNFKVYFEKYKNICIDKEITNKNVQKIDKTRFCADCSRVYQIIILDCHKPMLLTDLDNREYIISIKKRVLAVKKKQCRQY